MAKRKRVVNEKVAKVSGENARVRFNRTTSIQCAQKWNAQYLVEIVDDGGNNGRPAEFIYMQRERK